MKCRKSNQCRQNLSIKIPTYQFGTLVSFLYKAGFGEGYSPTRFRVAEFEHNASWFCCCSHFVIINYRPLVLADKTPRAYAKFGPAVESCSLFLSKACQSMLKTLHPIHSIFNLTFSPHHVIINSPHLPESLVYLHKSISKILCNIFPDQSRFTCVLCYRTPWR